MSHVFSIQGSKKQPRSGGAWGISKYQQIYLRSSTSKMAIAVLCFLRVKFELTLEVCDPLNQHT